MIAPPRTLIPRALMTGIVVGLIVAALTAAIAVALPAPAARAASASDVTVTAKGQDLDYATAPFPKLSVTVSQTKDLDAQGITVSWTGGAKSTFPSSQTGGENFLQIFQCWGDDPKATDQPDRTTCQYGSFNTPGAARDGAREPGTIASQDAAYTANADGDDPFNPPYTSIPFRAANGKTVASVVDSKIVSGVNVNSNEFFTAQTTNEVPWAGMGADGSGAAKFELQTGMQSPGLGCGNPVTSGSATTGASCWLVIVPRPVRDVGQQHITSSGLFWDAWKHRLAIRLDFKALGTRCAIGAAERQLAGSELAAIAVRSWQPALCGSSDGSIFSLLTGSESDALLAANSGDDAALALTSYPLGGDAGAGLRYAPIGLTGVTIGFAIDQNPLPVEGVPDGVASQARLPFTKLRLTPRLVAKLLSSSYRDALPLGADLSEIGYRSAAEPGHNARNLTTDPDFLAINDPAWAYQGIVSPAVADLLVPQGRGDAATAIWQYVLADADARSYLAGTPDPWGMVVNPWFSTTAAANPTGVALALPRDNFPKADPIEAPGAAPIPPVNVVTWRPYTNDLENGAYLTLRGDGQVLGSWDQLAIPPKFTKTNRDLPGSQKVLSVTDSSSAQRYQVLSAELRNPAGDFVAPSAASFAAAAAVMTPTAEKASVLHFDQGADAVKAAHDAYPLTVPLYAASNPTKLDAGNRVAYSAFIRYAAGEGQISGTTDGQLPPGYAPIPAAWAQSAVTQANAIAAGAPSDDVQLETEAFGDPGGSSNDSSPDSSFSSSAGGSQEAPQPSASGTAAAPLASGKTVADPAAALSGVLPASGMAGLVAALISGIASRRRGIRTWGRP
jgi:hypothetical protein